MLDLIKKEEVEKLSKSVPSYLKAAQEIKIKTAEDLEKAGIGLIKIIAEQKRIEAILKSAVGPAKESIKVVEGWFKPALNTLKEASELLRDKTGAYQTKVDADIEAKKVAIAEKADAGQMTNEKAGQKIADLEVKADKKIFSNTGGMSFTEHRFVKVVDLKKIPLEYLMPDMVKINQAILREGKEIAGCEIVVEKRPNIKTK